MKIKNWAKFQHFKDRRPPWIKLYRDILDDVEWFKLSPVAGKSLVMIWLVASEDNGKIPMASELAWRLRIGHDQMEAILNELLEAKFITTLEEEEAGDEDDLTPAQRLAKKNGFGSRYIPDAIKRSVHARDEGKCQHCGSVEGLEYDHVVPVSSGGESTHDNIQLLCRPCNRRKRTKSNELSKAQQDGCAERSLETETYRKEETEKKDTLAADAAVCIDLWNSMASRAGLSKAQAATKARTNAIKARLRECGGVEGWTAMLEIVERTPYLCGENDRGWRADLDFVTKQSKFTKIMEGGYGRSSKSTGNRDLGGNGFVALALGEGGLEPNGGALPG